MKLNMICIKFHKKCIKTYKPKIWTLRLLKVFKAKNLGFSKPFPVLVTEMELFTVFGDDDDEEPSIR